MDVPSPSSFDLPPGNEDGGQRLGKTRFLRGGTSGALPSYLAALQADFQTLLRSSVRSVTADVCPMVEIRSLVNGRCAYFHPPTAAILVYEEPQKDDILLEAHQILEQQPAYIDRLEKDQQVSSIEYYATGACNLRCGYCYLGALADRPQTVDLQPSGFLSRVERLFGEGRIARRLRVSMIGGEPLLAFQGLRQVVDGVERMARLHRVDVSFGITTNGYLLDESTAIFLREHRIAVKVSCDGRFSERNRPVKENSLPTAHVDLARVRRLAESIPVTLNATLLPPQFESQAQVFAELAGAGFSTIQISVANGLQWTTRDLRRFFRGLCSLTWEAQRCGLLEVQQEHIMSVLRDYKLRRSHCGAGVSHIAIDAEGQIRGCSTSFNPGGHGRQSTYGLYDVDLDPACNACAFRYGCAGGCRAFRGAGQPSITDCAPIYLRFLMAIGLAAELPGFQSEMVEAV